MTVLSIVGGGWSFQGVDHKRLPGNVIAVNDAMKYLQCSISYIVSMDRLWTEHRWNDLCNLAKPTFIRRAALKNVNLFRRNWLQPFDNSLNEPLMSLDPTVLNGANSGACAINLAFTMRPKELYLFGFDMCRSSKGEVYWHPPYPWAKQSGGTGNKRYVEWATSKFLRTAAQQFMDLGTKVLNVSMESKIAVFERVSAKDLGIAV